MRLHVCRSLYCASFYGFSYTYLIALTSVLLFLLLLLCMILFQVSSQVIIILYKLLLTVVVACRAAGSPIFVLHSAHASAFPSDLLFVCLFVCLFVGWLVGWLVAYVLYYARASFSLGDLPVRQPMQTQQLPSVPRPPRPLDNPRVRSLLHLRHQLGQYTI